MVENGRGMFEVNSTECGWHTVGCHLGCPDSNLHALIVYKATVMIEER